MGLNVLPTVKVYRTSSGVAKIKRKLRINLTTAISSSHGDEDRKDTGRQRDPETDGDNGQT